jgi:DNA repair photolyase
MIPLQLSLVPEGISDARARGSDADAAHWHTLDRRERGTTFIEMPTRTVLNPPSATGMGFWSINPYVGCEFGCTYCYARDTHRYAVERARADGTLDASVAEEFVGLEGWEAFERRILVKTGAERVLARTLRPARIGGRPIVIGTATDPYQPAERRFGLTRRILEALLAHRGLTLVIITKSPLVTRDTELLRRLAQQHDVSVNVSLASLDPLVLRRLEPRSPTPRVRLRAMAELAQAKIDVGLFIAPIIPRLTDGRRELSRLIDAARGAGAQWVMGSTLRLGPAARRRFLPHLESAFPELADRYRRHYGQRTGASAAYREAVSARLDELRAEHGVTAGSARARRAAARAAAPAGGVVQGTLFEG